MLQVSAHDVFKNYINNSLTIKQLKLKNFKIYDIQVTNLHINIMLQSSKIHYKSNELFSILREYLGKNSLPYSITRFLLGFLPHVWTLAYDCLHGVETPSRHLTDTKPPF